LTLIVGKKYNLTFLEVRIFFLGTPKGEKT
jgi:hypothetical protein